MTIDYGTALHCPERPSTLGLVVPNDSWWPLQRETIDLIIDAMIGHGKKFVLAGIPTGGGKTLIASAVQKILAGSVGGRNGGNSLVLTHTIQLQQQYTKTLSDASVVTGRRNHLCELPMDSEHRIGVIPPESMTAEDAPCGDCTLNSSEGCSYYRQFYAAASAPMTVMNYAYAGRILQIPQFKGWEFNPFRRDLLVADECHLTADAIIDAAGIKLWTGVLSRAGVYLPAENTRIAVTEGGPRSQKTANYENTQVWIDWAKLNVTTIGGLLSTARREFNGRREAHASQATLSKARATVKSFESLYKALHDIAAITNPDEWIVRRDKNPARHVVSVTVQPLWGWSVADEMLWRHFGHVLLMSATPGDPEIARIKLGIPKEDFEYIERPSTFPVENRPVYFWDVVKLNYASDEQDWDRATRAIGWIATRPENVNRKGLVHSGSAANARRIVGLLEKYLPGRAFTHTAGDANGYSREEALEEFTASPDPRILVTASFTTGLDLPYVIGWQVIAKVPFGSLGDEITARKRAFKLPNGYPFGQKNYEAECANTVVQACGRIVRSPVDSGPTYIIDGNFAAVRAQAYFPRFWVDAYTRMVID